MTSAEEGERMYPPITSWHRELSIGTGSTKLMRLIECFKNLGIGNSVEHMSGFIPPNYNTRWLIVGIQTPTDPPTETRSHEIAFLTSGSPIMREVLYQISTYILEQNIPGQPFSGKLMI